MRINDAPIEITGGLSDEEVAEIVAGFGGLEVSAATPDSLTALAAPKGEVRFDRKDPAAAACAEKRVTEMLQLIVASREYQLA